MIFPNDNLPSGSKTWGREVTKQLSNVIDARQSDEINNAARDNQLNSSIIATQAVALNAQNTADAVTAIVDNIYVDGTTNLDGGVLASGTLNAEKIIAGTLTGFTIQTAATGARVMMDASGLRAYNSSNTQLLNFSTSTGALTVSGGAISGGTITGTTISGGIVQTGSSGQRVTLSGVSNSIFFYDVNGDQVGSMNGGGIGREGEFRITGPASNYFVSFSSANALFSGAGQSIEFNNQGIIPSGFFNNLRVTGNNISGDTSSTQGPLVVTDTTGLYMKFDGNEISQYGSALYLNGTGATGNVIIANGGGAILAKGVVGKVDSTSIALRIATDGTLCTSTSSERFKQDIQDAGLDINSILALSPRKFRYKELVNKLGDAAPMAYGFIAEEADELGLTGFVHYDDNDEVFAFDYANYVVALQTVVKYQEDTIQDLIKRVEILEGK